MAATATPTNATVFADPEIGEGTPLLRGSGQDNEKPLEEIEDWTRREKAVAGVSALSFVSSAAGMMISPDPVVLASGTIGCAVAPYVAIQQHKITHVKALAETNQRISEEVDQLKGENSRLKAQVQELSDTVKNLQVQKKKLDTIQSVQGASIGELEQQLDETRKIHEKMHRNLQGDILNNLIEVALAFDGDANMVLSDEEIDEIISKLEKVHGITLDNEGIRRVVIQNGRCLDAIMEVIKNLLRDDIPLDQSLFRESQKLEN